MRILKTDLIYHIVLLHSSLQKNGALLHVMRSITVISFNNSNNMNKIPYVVKRIKFLLDKETLFYIEI